MCVDVDVRLSSLLCDDDLWLWEEAEPEELRLTSAELEDDDDFLGNCDDDADEEEEPLGSGALGLCEYA